jgi:hypothetical protein
MAALCRPVRPYLAMIRSAEKNVFILIYVAEGIFPNIVVH